MKICRTVPVISLLVLLTTGCGRSPNVTPPPVVRVPAPESGPPVASADESAAPVPDATTFVQEGQASWYGDPYHGRRAASGEVFDKNKLTAAHRTLAFDTWVRVENQLNGRSVDVRINDRGPFVSGRIIDVSEAAAREIGLLGLGVAPVRVTVLKVRDAESLPPAASTVLSDDFYVVQLGAFSIEENAYNLMRDLSGRYTGIYVEPPAQGSSLHRVLIGRANLDDARRVQEQLRSQEGIESILVQVAD